MRKILTLFLLAALPCVLFTTRSRRALSAVSNAPQTVRYIEADTHVVPTNISGSKGTSQIIKEPGSHAFLHGLDFDEKGDKPCFIRMHWWRHNSTELRSTFTTFFDICSGDADGDKSLVYDYSDSTHPAVTAIQVGSNKDNHRLKGARVTFGFIDLAQSGTVTSLPLPPFGFERTNLDTWKSTESCRAGMAAVGLVVEHTKSEITGLGLRCAIPKIKVVQLPATPVVSGRDRFMKMERDIRVQVDKDGRTETMTIQQAVDRHEVNAVSVVIIYGGAITTVAHYGVRSRKTKLPVNGDTIYQIGSTAKMLAGIGMLVAARKPHGPILTETVQTTAREKPSSLVARWVDKQFKGSDVVYPSNITVERLLSHTASLDTSGIGAHNDDGPTKMESILLGSFGNPGVKPLGPVPGTFFSYSGGGFTAAEAVLEARSGRTATDFLTDEVLKPFGMTKSTYADAKDSMTNLARVCSRGLCSDSPAHTNVKFAGGLLANPEEFAKLLLIILNDGKDSAGKQVLPKEDVQRLITPAAHRDSSFKVCSTQGQCVSAERCYGGQCIRPITGASDWYGLGVRLEDGADFNGFPSRLWHGGAQTDVESYFYLDRGIRYGIFFVIAGEEKWKKKNVE